MRCATRLWVAEAVDSVIIGAGLAGISAALELKSHGINSVILESQPHLGGRARSFSSTAGLLPAGPTSFTGRTAAMWWLIEKLSLDNEVIEACAGVDRRFLQRGHTLHALSQSPLSLLFSGALTLSEKLSLAKRLQGAPAPEQEETLQTFFEKQLGPSLANSVAAAFVAGILGAPLSSLSAEACFPELVARARQHGGLLKSLRTHKPVTAPGTRKGIFTFRGGLQTLLDRAQSQLRVQTDCAVKLVTQADGGYLVESTGGVYRTTRLVVATALSEVPKLFASDDIVTSVRTFRHVPLAVVRWKTVNGVSAFAKGFGFLAVPQDESFSLGTLFVGDILGGPPTYATLVGGGFHPERCELSDEDIFAGVTKDIRALGINSEMQNIDVVRWPEAVVTPSLGHAQRVKNLTDTFTSRYRGAALAGASLGTGGLRDAIETGRTAAQRLVEVPAS